MIKKIILLILLIILTMNFTGCSTLGTATPTTPVDTSTETTEAYQPPVVIPLVESYPEPADPSLNNFPAKIDIPQPQKDTGVVTGIILIQGENKAYLGTLLLGQMVYSDNNKDAPPLVSFSEETDPKAIIDQTGRFVFDNIKPGDYGIIIWTPATAVLLSNPDTGDSVKFNVEAGKVVDLGTLYIK